MPEDMELQAMSRILEAIEPLELDAQKRIFQWIQARLGLHGVVVKPETNMVVEGKNPLTPTMQGGPALSSFESIAEAFSAAGPPQTDTKRALVVASYLQVVEGKPDVTGYDVNSELKHLGFQINNITLAFAGLMNTRPQLAVQVRKTGTSRQSRKSYRVTIEGIREVERMLGEGSNQQA